jgi:(p)ppGpp synthase/HD superfamily hydrolase
VPSAALLHDSVEDAGGLPTLHEVRARFGDRVADIVYACSDSTDEEWKRSVGYWERKQRYLDHLEQKADADALLVSTADKLHNARSLVTDLRRDGAQTLDRFNGTRQEVLTYYSECLRIAKIRGVSDTLTLPFEDAVNEIRSFIAES